MGVNISITKLKWVEHPEWDSSRYAGDREFASLLFRLPHLTAGDEREYIRPCDFVAWRAAVKEDAQPNPGRWTHLVDLLEKNPDYWVYVGS